MLLIFTKQNTLKLYTVGPKYVCMAVYVGVILEMKTSPCEAFMYC